MGSRSKTVRRRDPAQRLVPDLETLNGEINRLVKYIERLLKLRDNARFRVGFLAFNTAAQAIQMTLEAADIQLIFSPGGVTWSRCTNPSKPSPMTPEGSLTITDAAPATDPSVASAGDSSKTFSPA